MAERTNSIHLNVRRTDELLSQLSSYSTRLGVGNTRQNASTFDDLRASINSLDLDLKLQSPKGTRPLLSKSPTKQCNKSPLRSAVNINKKENHSFSHNYAHYRSSLSPLKQTYETQEEQIKLPIHNLIFEKLNASMNRQATKLSEWDSVLKKVLNFENNSENINMDNAIEDIQNSGNELIDLQISTLENLSHDTAPYVFNDNKIIHKISQMLGERQSKLESEKINSDQKLSQCTKKRETYERELEQLTQKLSEARNNESLLNNQLHAITMELTSMSDQLSMVNSMKQKINNNLQKMNECENELLNGINNLKTYVNNEWKQFESKWRHWKLNEIAIWINNHGLQLQYDKDELIANMENKLKIEKGSDLLKLNKTDWIAMGITNARDRQYLRNEFGVLTAPPLNANDIEHFKCPLTKQLMSDPVIAADGYTYERASIAKWFQNNQKEWNNIKCVVSPISGDILTTDMTFSNHQLFKQIQDYKKANNIV